MTIEKHSFQEKPSPIGNIVSGNPPINSDSMDARRQAATIQDFLLKLDQARDWVCSITNTNLDITSFTEELPKGILLARVAKSFDPTFVKKIFEAPVKEYKHVDNIVMFFDWCKKIKLRKHFLFETIDLYESKNIPKVIYCLHGLASFLNKRGISKGIVINKNVKFSEEETLLFSSEFKNVSIPSFDNIESKLDSEESDTEVPIQLREVTSPIAHPEKFHKAFARTLIWKKSFDNLMSCTNIDIATIRRFMSSSDLDDPSYQVIKDQQAEIMRRFTANNKKEIEIDSLVHTIRLIHENIQMMRGVVTDPYPPANDFKNAKMVLFRLIHDTELCFKILAAGFELPLRTIFPDTILGDFLFTKFIRKSIEINQMRSIDEGISIDKTNITDQARFIDHGISIDKSNFNQVRSIDHVKSNLDNVISIARSHFISSKIFQNISEVFSTSQNFDLNPTNIMREFYPSEKNILLDDALNDELVKKEILKRSQMIVEFIDSKFKFLLNVNLPYYVKIFASHPSFYENFIEPAILASGNHYILELFSYIFNHSVFDDCMGLERVIKDKEGICKSNSIDFSDYSPLKNYLNECKSGIRNFRDLLSKHHSTNTDPNDYFIDCASPDDLLELEISIEEINNIIIVLKHNTNLMTPEFATKIKNLGLIRANTPKTVKINVYSLLDESREIAPIRVNGEISFDDHRSYPSKYREIEISNDLNNECSGGLDEKFVLKLDNQFSYEIDRIESENLKSVSHKFKKNLLELILRSEKNNLVDILQEDEEIQKLVRSSHKEILEDLVRDFLSRKFGSLTREISLNSETLDALFHKGVKLDLTLKNLYKYTNDLTALIFKNKCGFFFNRQVEPNSRFGTYLIPLDNFNANVYESLDSSQMSVRISCEEPMIVYVSILFKQEILSQPIPLRFDSLLKLREEKVQCIDISEVCTFSVGATISVINECYVNY